MVNKKSKFLLYISCLLLLFAIGFFWGLNFQTQPTYATTNGIVSEEIKQTSNLSTHDIFENYTQTSLKKEYNDKSVLDQLKENEEITIDEYNRAIEVLEGNAKFTPKREFSTRFKNDNKIDQVGDIAQYSQDKLKCIWKASELILTGIYGKPDNTFNVFVEAGGTTNNLPYIMFSQNHGYYLHWYEKYQLKIGMNKLTFPTFGLGYIEKDEIRGGAIYLCNPYTPEEQGEVNVYIEGGGYYPIFRKGGNEKEFLNFLNEYESERESKQLLNMAELVTDHAIISTTSSSLYDVYINNDVITPSENLNLWGNYFTTLFEFNGIPTSKESNLGDIYDPRNDYVKINFRYMTYYPGSGAYSYSYHIGWYYEHYWFANFYNAKNPLKDHKLTEHLIFGIGHELGHALDNDPRKINETTNNFTAAMAYFNIVGMPHYEQYQPFEKTLTALSNDYKLDYLAYDDGQIMYTKTAYPTNYDHNYLIWWDLEAVFPGFWARFNNYFRNPLKAGLTTTELYVYYSSLATGVDLSNYYERWGFYYGKKSYVGARFIYDNASTAFKEAMQEAEDNQLISKQYDHFWYVDANQYSFIREHENVTQADREYKDGKPTISKILRSNNERTIFINSNKSEYHLGYEILSKVNNENWKIVGFTYTSSFVDKTYYTSTPTYKVLAINRFFKASAESEPVYNVTVESPYVCKVNDVLYDNLSTAISQAEENSTVYLLGNCSVDGKYIVKNITLQIDDSVNNDIYISNNNSTSMFIVQSNFSVIGKENARIIFDGGSSNSGNPAIYGTHGKIIIKNAIFRNFNTMFLAGAIFTTDSDVEVHNTSFNSCNSAKNDAAIYASKILKLDNCNFSNNLLDVYVKDLENLTLANQTSKLTLGFDKFEEEKSIAGEGNLREIAEQIELKIDGYIIDLNGNQIIVKPLSFKLKFNFNNLSFDYFIKNALFVFGSEDYDYNLLENQYIEYEQRGTGIKYQTDDKIVLNNDMEFDVIIKNKLCLKIFYENIQSINYYTYGYEVYLPTADSFQNEVLAYKDGNKVYNAGQTYIMEKESSLVAIYQGNLTYRYIVKNEILSVGYGSYGQTINLLKLEQEGFLGWQCGDEFVSTSTSLKGDMDFIAVFSGELPDIYDLTLCKIQIEGAYTYSGENIVPKILVYFNGLIVPSNCYLVSCSNNVLASNWARVTISSVEGLSTGSKTQFFTILPKELKLNEINVIGLKNFVYNGSQTEQNLKITYKNEEISTFLLDYIGNRTNAGKVQLKITFSGNYSGNIYLEYTISKADRTNFSVSLSNWVYGENAPTPQIENIGELSPTTYTYSNSLNGVYTGKKPTSAGTYWIKAEILESDNYNSAVAKAQFTIMKAEKPNVNTTIHLKQKPNKLSDIILPTGFEWENGSETITSNKITAKAIYKGTDADSYETTEIYFEIIIEDQPSMGYTWLFIFIPVGVIISCGIGFAIIRSRRNKW